MSRKKLKIGLFGFGCVGEGLYSVIQNTPTLQSEIKTICVIDRNKKRNIPNSYFTFDKEDILEDKEIDIVIELIDDADAAFEITKEAVKNGKAVVTANKKMIAEYLQELLDLQKQYKVPILYEAACCASIPVIRNLEEYFDNDLLESVQGIVNGSTNFILTKLANEKIGFDAALKFAQLKGFAESDPTLDTNGFDAKYKLIILLAHSFGIIAKPNQIFNISIQHLSDLELKFAAEKGFKIKLIAHAERTNDGKIIAFVLPKFIPKNDKLFSVDDVFNGIKIQSCFSDTQFFYGKGAGAFPTASAVISDISALSYNYRYEYKKMHTPAVLANDDDVHLNILLKHSLQFTNEIKSHFTYYYESYSNHESGYLIGNITLKNLKVLCKKFEGEISPILFEASYSQRNPTLLKERKLEMELN